MVIILYYFLKRGTKLNAIITDKVTYRKFVLTNF